MCNVAITCIFLVNILVDIMLCGRYLIKCCPGRYPRQPHWPLYVKMNICLVDLTGITGALLGWKSHHYSIPFTAGSTLSSSGTRFTDRAAFPFMSSDRRWKRWQSSRCLTFSIAQDLSETFVLKLVLTDMGVWEDILITKFACFETLPHIDWSQAVSGGGHIYDKNAIF